MHVGSAKINEKAIEREKKRPEMEYIGDLSLQVVLMLFFRYACLDCIKIPVEFRNTGIVFRKVNCFL